TQDAEVPRIHIRSARSLAFTVYKLDRPSRVVLDLPRAQLAEALIGHETAIVLTPNTWAVSTIAAQQVEDGGSLVRLSVTLARPGRYEVKPAGNDLVLIVTARDPAPAVVSDGGKLEAERLARVRAEQASSAAQKEAAAARAAATPPRGGARPGGGGGGGWGGGRGATRREGARRQRGHPRRDRAGGRSGERSARRGGARSVGGGARDGHGQDGGA